VVDAVVTRRGGGAAQEQVVEAAHGHVHAPLPAQRILLQALRASQGHAPGHQQGHRRRHHQRQGPPVHVPAQRVQDHREAHRPEVHGLRRLRNGLRAKKNEKIKGKLGIIIDTIKEHGIIFT
jgi:hypothetical protein